MLARRTARRTYRRPILPPLRAASSHRRPGGRGRALRWLSSALPPGGAGGPPGGEGREPTKEELEWLAGQSLHFEQIARRLGAGSDAPDVAQEAIKGALEAWGTWSEDPNMPRAMLLRRWITGFLFRAVARNRYRVKRDWAAGPKDAERARVPSFEGPTAARWTLRTLQGETAPEFWRAWVAYYVDGYSAPQIAHDEGLPLATIYDRLRRARRDLRAAMKREDARAAGPLVPRKRPKGSK